MAAILTTIEREHGDDAAGWLAMKLGAQPEIRALRRAQRDDVIRQAVELLAPMPITAAAERLARELEHRLRPSDAQPPAPGTLAALADRIIQLNGFAPLTGRRINSICKQK
ncbi:hypothetical protein ACMS1Z_00285 [Acidiphilium multivorum]|uniref:hypothetical protein n=1 Tax=Acidiphilium multivorum TaxID=62140 RepID=UPI0039C97BD6